jgi:hypothetical protein
VCRPEALSLAETLVAASGHAEDAEAVLSRQTRNGGGGRGGSSEPLPVDLTASAKLGPITTTIGTWQRVLIEEGYAAPPGPWRPVVGPPCPPWRPGDAKRPGGRCGHPSCAQVRDRTPPGPLAAACLWLATQVGQLRKHPAAGEAFRDLHDACAALERLNDGPASKVLVGMCDCGTVMYALHGKDVVQCPERTCKLLWGVAESRDILRRALDGKLVTAAEAARLGAYLDTDRNQLQIRKLINSWAMRGLVVPHGWITVPHECDVKCDVKCEVGPTVTSTFRFGDVAGRLARTPRRAAARAVESEDAA